MTAVEHELVNARGDRVRLIDYGARIRSMQLMIDGALRDVVLGYATAGDYAKDTYYMGAIAGRYCNRIGGSRFSIDGIDYRLPGNEGAHHLHGGPHGFSMRHWRPEPGMDRQSIDFKMVSEDGDQGYPGTLSVAVRYAWNDDRELLIRYRATTDRPTYVNLTSHVYFNLDAQQRDIVDHELRIASSRVTAVDRCLIPTGELADVAGAGLDFRRRTRIGRILASRPPMLAGSGGIDLNYVLDPGAPAADLWSSEDDLRMTVETSYPGLQFYTGHHLEAPWQPFAGLCLEAQYFPDSPNHPGFPDTLLQPGGVYDEFVRYRFAEG